MAKELVRIGVVGSRRRNSEEDKKAVFQAIMDVIDEYTAVWEDDIQFELVSGGCQVYNRETKKYEGCGADYFAELFAREVGIPIMIYYPRKNEMDPTRNKFWEYGRVCKERNTLIAERSHELIAAVSDDRKGGTEDTVTKFDRIQKKKVEFSPRPPVQTRLI